MTKSIEIRQYEDTSYYVSTNGEVFKKLNPYLSAKGYWGMKLYINGKKLNTGVHRLVAKAFIDNPNNYEQVNHKDENKLNNSVDNLEWCSNKYNANYGNRISRIAEKIRKPIISIDRNGNRKRFDSIREAAKFYGIDPSSISRAAKKEYYTSGGFFWRYE